MKYKGFYVALDTDYRYEDLQSMIAAVKMIKGVVDVDVINTDISDALNRMRIKQEFLMRLSEFYEEISKGG